MADLGADSTAIAWAMSKNKCQSDWYTTQKKLFKKGIIDGGDGNVKEIIEDEPIPEAEDFNFYVISPNSWGVPYDWSLPTDGDVFFGDMRTGIKFDCGEITIGEETDHYWMIIKADMSLSYVYLYLVSANIFAECKGLINIQIWCDKKDLVYNTYTTGTANYTGVEQILYPENDKTPTRYGWIDRWNIKRTRGTLGIRALKHTVFSSDPFHKVPYDVSHVDDNLLSTLTSTESEEFGVADRVIKMSDTDYARVVASIKSWSIL